MRSKDWPRFIFGQSVLAVCALSLAGCRGSVPEQALSRPLPAVARPAPAAKSGVWTFHPSTERRAYVLEQHAILTINQDTTVRVDSVFSHAEVAFTSFAATGRVTGWLSVFRVKGPAHEPTIPVGLVLPFAFSADYPAHGRQLVFSTAGAGAPCASSGLAVAQSFRDLWFQPPDTLRLGTTWDDSASYIICRDGIPLRAIVQRTFHITGVEERAGRLALLLSRSSRTAIEAEAQLPGEAISVSGSGTGEFSYAIDPSSGEILSASGSAMFDLMFRSRFRRQRVHQVSDTRLVRGA
jgi:hypothetical protein